ncbi:MAG TPA: hypothetical protein VGF94_08110 [Kofleriaceae bacterium]|jgi:hypothetical protein
MLTKAQAAAIAAQYVSTFPALVEAQLEANAARGITGVTNMPYPPAATQGQINGFTAQMQGIGWTVAVDEVNFLITLS